MSRGGAPSRLNLATLEGECLPPCNRCSTQVLSKRLASPVPLQGSCSRQTGRWSAAERCPSTRSAPSTPTQVCLQSAPSKSARVGSRPRCVVPPQGSYAAGRGETASAITSAASHERASRQLASLEREVRLTPRRAFLPSASQRRHSHPRPCAFSAATFFLTAPPRNSTPLCGR